jgi:hypothetical protein
MIQTLTAGDDSPHMPRNALIPPVPRPQQAPDALVDPPDDPILVHAGSPEELLAVVPHLLGFVPQASLVVIGIEPPRHRVKVTLRYDLPDPPGAGVAADVADHAVAVIGSQRLNALVAVGYGPSMLVDPVADALRAAARTAGIDVADVLRVQDARYWSYLCRDDTCCPSAGTPFDPGGHRALTAMTGVAEAPEAPEAAAAAVPAGEAGRATEASTGNRVLADRAAVAARVAPLGGIAAESMRQATRQAERHVGQVLAKVRKSSRLGAARQMIAAEGLNAVGSMIAAYRGGDKYRTDYQIAWITVALRDLRVRDDAWARMDPWYRDAHRRLWIDVTRRAQPGYVAAPAALLAFVAWQSGDGALANVALDRALADEPGYSMAQLLRQVITAGAPPSLARLPMTPEEVAASYDDASYGACDEACDDHEPDPDVHDPDSMSER